MCVGISLVSEAVEDKEADGELSLTEGVRVAYTMPAVAMTTDTQVHVYRSFIDNIMCCQQSDCSAVFIFVNFQ